MLEVIDYNEYAEKIRAYQSPPEYADSNFWMDYSEKNNGTWLDDLLIISDEFKGKTNDLFDLIVEYAEEATEAADDFKTIGNCYYFPFCRNYTEYIKERFKPCRRLSTRNIHKLKQLFATIADAYNAESATHEIADAMTIVSGEKWETSRLTGYTQGDVVHAIYKPCEWSREALEEIETEYFNGGSGWNVDDPEQDLCCYIYSTGLPGYDDEKIIQDIADAIGADPAQIELVTC